MRLPATSSFFSAPPREDASLARNNSDSIGRY